MADGERFCRACGRDSTAPMPTAPVPAVPAAQYGVAAPGVPAETSGKAIISLICGIFLFFFPASIVAIIFGHLALSEIRKSAGRLAGQGMAIAGLVLGYAGVAFIPIVLIIAAIAIPNLLHARIAANEAAAVAEVRTLAVAEVSYAAAHHDTGFTCSLSDLASEQPISRELASGKKRGYVFELENCSADTSGGANTKFQVVAHPVTLNTTGKRAFCSDESGVVKVDAEGSVQGCLENGAPLE